METHNSLYHLQRVYYVQWQTRTAVLGGMWLLGTGGTCDCYSLDVTILGKAAVLHFTLTPFCSWGCANPACRLFDIAVLMSRSHRFLILHSPYPLPLLSPASSEHYSTLDFYYINFYLDSTYECNYVAFVFLCLPYFILIPL
jgi:hypothetical protein